MEVVNPSCALAPGFPSLRNELLVARADLWGLLDRVSADELRLDQMDASAKLQHLARRSATIQSVLLGGEAWRKKALAVGDPRSPAARARAGLPRQPPPLDQRWWTIAFAHVICEDTPRARRIVGAVR